MTFLRCQCGKADEYREPFWSPLRRLEMGHIDEIPGDAYRTEHRPCKRVKYVRQAKALALIAAQRVVKKRTLAAAR